MSDQSVGGPVDRDVGRDVRTGLVLMIAGPYWSDTAKGIARPALAELDRLCAENKELRAEVEALRADAAELLNAIAWWAAQEDGYPENVVPAIAALKGRLGWVFDPASDRARPNAELSGAG